MDTFIKPTSSVYNALANYLDEQRALFVKQFESKTTPTNKDDPKRRPLESRN